VPAAPASPAPVRHTPRGERTATRILDRAEALFAERGYHGTTLRDVADAVGLRIPSLYNHFEGKEALYAAVLERGMRPALEALSETLAAGPDADAASGAMVERMMEILRRHPHLPRLIQHETLAGGPHLTPMLRHWMGPVLARARQLVESNRAAAHFGPEEAPLVVLALYHAVVGYFTAAPLYREIEGENLLSREALARQTRFLTKMVALLFPERAADEPH